MDEHLSKNRNPERRSDLNGPSSRTPRMLLIEDNLGDARLVQAILNEGGPSPFTIDHVTRIGQGLERLKDQGYDVILLDLSLPDGSGLDTVVRVCEVTPHLPVVVLTGLDDENAALGAVQQGAQDYLVKGQFDRNALMRSIRYAIERKRGEEKLRESEERFRQLAEHIREVFYMWTPDVSEAIYVSPAYEVIWGHTCESLYQDPKSFWEAIHPADRERVIASLEKRGEVELEELYRIVRPDRSVRWVRDRSFPVRDDSGKAWRVVGIAEEITEIKEVEEKLRHLSLHDPLTGLYNRAHFEEELARLEGNNSEVIGIIACDLDGLKFINDTLGHENGDHLLTTAAKVVKECFRGGDTIARIGGDEFAVILRNVTPLIVEAACDRIQRNIQRYNDANPRLPLSISVGWATRDGLQVSLRELFKEADNNMYRQKLYRSKSVRSGIVRTLMNTLRARDIFTEEHAARLERLVLDLGLSIGLPESAATGLRLLAHFHDIGKVGVPDRILLKPGPLAPEEQHLMRLHCEIGYRIALSAPDLKPIADWILKHHEWWNGQGYPQGAKGEETPIESRIMAVADAYEAMTSDRPYRKARSRAEAVAELQRCAGTQFDPQIVAQFVHMLELPRISTDAVPSSSPPWPTTESDGRDEVILSASRTTEDFMRSPGRCIPEDHVTSPLPAGSEREAGLH